ncbi:MAG: hypothetical protein COA95_05085 [Methylophaga sp.]|nr:MAG: hypothetical protein COA95_05085 [Methylophaga sp.]
MKKFLVLLSALLLSVQVQAALVSVTGGGEILLTALNVQEDAETNDHQQGFNEQQGVLIGGAGVNVDSGSVAAGMRVDSHLIFLNTPSGTPVTDTGSTWVFSGNIIGVMSDIDGGLMAATDGIFAAFNTYFADVGGSGFANQGLEGSFDGYAFSGNVLKLSMRVTEPGDWIRVITVSAVPVPAALFLFAPALLGFLGLRRKVSSTVA